MFAKENCSFQAYRKLLRDIKSDGKYCDYSDVLDQDRDTFLILRHDNAGCFVAHNAVVGRNAILITGCRLYGSSDIGENAYLASAMVRNQCRVGAGAMMGMGAVVTRNMPPDVVAVGVPAEVIGERK